MSGPTTWGRTVPEPWRPITDQGRDHNGDKRRGGRLGEVGHRSILGNSNEGSIRTRARPATGR